MNYIVFPPKTFFRNMNIQLTLFLSIYRAVFTFKLGALHTGKDIFPYSNAHSNGFCISMATLVTDI